MKIYEVVRDILLKRKEVIKLTANEERLLEVLDPIKYDDNYRREFFEYNTDLRRLMYSFRN